MSVDLRIPESKDGNIEVQEVGRILKHPVRCICTHRSSVPRNSSCVSTPLKPYDLV